VSRSAGGHGYPDVDDVDERAAIGG
jgi:hypothetical protein